jgi:protein-disulfide isomerase
MKSYFNLSILTFGLFALSACSSNTAGPRPSIGPDNAPVVVDEYSDLQCPACASVSPEVERIARDNPDLIKLTFHHFPLPQHESAFRAAQASECANEQGKFWEFADSAFQNQSNLTDSKFIEIAESLNLNKPQFQACLDSNISQAPVRADLSLGNSMGVSYTPSFFVNGKLIRYSGRETFEGYLRTLK